MEYYLPISIRIEIVISRHPVAVSGRTVTTATGTQKGEFGSLEISGNKQIADMIQQIPRNMIGAKTARLSTL